jgi:hypothetical protein
MPGGKPAGIRCTQLDEHDRCLIFGRPTRPGVCSSLQPERTMCGDDREHALHWLGHLEKITTPNAA